MKDENIKNNLRESYKAEMNKMKKENRVPKNAEIIDVTRTTNSVLAPSWNLLNDYKNGKINWDGYTRRFYEEMNDDISKNKMKEIYEICKSKPVYLVCFEKRDKNCHRFLLMDMILNKWFEN